MRTVSVHAVSIEGSIGKGQGVDVETGEIVIFVGDHRPMYHLGEALEYEGPIEVEVEGWQVLAVTPA